MNLMTDRLLSDQEIRDITGFEQPARQVQFIREQLGLNPIVRADGRPRLTFTAINHVMVNNKSTASNQPRFDLIRNK